MYADIETLWETTTILSNFHAIFRFEVNASYDVSFRNIEQIQHTDNAYNLNLVTILLGLGKLFNTNNFIKNDLN